MVPVGSGAREDPTHGVPGGGRFVDGCGEVVARDEGGGGWSGWTVQSWTLGVGGVWRWWVCPATGDLLRGSDEGEDCSGTEAGEPTAREWGLAAGYPRLGWPGCPGAPWGRRLPTSAGCETTACFSVTEVLRFRPQELTRRGDCGPGRPRGMIMKRKWGARMSLAVGTFLRPGGGRCPGLLPLPCARGAVVGGGAVPPNRRLCPVPWAQTPVGGGYEAPGRLAPPAQQPARRC